MMRSELNPPGFRESIVKKYMSLKKIKFMIIKLL